MDPVWGFEQGQVIKLYHEKILRSILGMTLLTLTFILMVAGMATFGHAKLQPSWSKRDMIFEISIIIYCLHSQYSIYLRMVVGPPRLRRSCKRAEMSLPRSPGPYCQLRPRNGQLQRGSKYPQVPKAMRSTWRLLCSSFLDMTCFIFGIAFYYPKRNYIGVSR